MAIPAENSNITANAFDGTGGQITITAQGVFGIEPRLMLTPLSDITASSENGVNGIVAIATLDTSFIQNSLTELPEQFINPDALITNSCVVQAEKPGGTFTISRENLLPGPNDISSTTYATDSVQTIPPLENSLALPSAHAIIEPSGIYQTTDGRLVMSRAC